MVRRDQYNIYYLGFPPQLFDLEKDPDELNDLAGQPETQSVESELHTLVLENWDPNTFGLHMAIKKSEYEIIESWARKTHPEERYIWPLTPDMDYLDKDYVYKDGR